MIADLNIAIAQINPTVGDIGRNMALVKDALNRCNGADLVVFPELVVCGYPPEDLILIPSFVLDCKKAVDALLSETAGGPAFVLTMPWMVDGAIYNAALLIESAEIRHIVYKNALPTYGVFDETRTFAKGPLPEPVSFKGKKIGIMICEDMWHADAAAALKNAGAEILIVPNGSPFETGKHEQRMFHAQNRVRETGLPLVYVNQYGGQDDLVFDGGSFALDSSGICVFQVPLFKEYIGPAVNVIARPETHAEIYGALVMGLKDYVAKNNFPGVLIGMSGGIDSALTAAIAVDALGPGKVRCVMMPSPFTSQDSFEDAQGCAKALGCYYEIMGIEKVMAAFEGTIHALQGLAHENMQSRVRGTILMSLSNQSGWMVVTTGNKSEMACGYATLYGDMCGGYNALKDVYKTLVYKLAAWRNAQSPVIPGRILSKAPSAELRPNQTDQDSLPPYDILDGILEGLIEERLSPEELADKGFDLATAKRVRNMLDSSEYKRRQSAPGPKITSRAFGRDRRMPIVNRHRFAVEKQRD